MTRTACLTPQSLHDIPAGNCVKLRVLSLHANRIAELPAEFANLGDVSKRPSPNTPNHTESHVWVSQFLLTTSLHCK